MWPQLSNKVALGGGPLPFFKDFFFCSLACSSVEMSFNSRRISGRKKWGDKGRRWRIHSAIKHWCKDAEKLSTTTSVRKYLASASASCYLHNLPLSHVTKIPCAINGIIRRRWQKDQLCVLFQFSLLCFPLLLDKEQHIPPLSETLITSWSCRTMRRGGPASLSAAHHSPLVVSRGHCSAQEPQEQRKWRWTIEAAAEPRSRAKVRRCCCSPSDFMSRLLIYRKINCLLCFILSNCSYCCCYITHEVFL